MFYPNKSSINKPESNQISEDNQEGDQEGDQPEQEGDQPKQEDFPYYEESENDEYEDENIQTGKYSEKSMNYYKDFNEIEELEEKYKDEINEDRKQFFSDFLSMRPLTEEDMKDLPLDVKKIMQELDKNRSQLYEYDTNIPSTSKVQDRSMSHQYRNKVPGRFSSPIPRLEELPENFQTESLNDGYEDQAPARKSMNSWFNEKSRSLSNFTPNWKRASTLSNITDKSSNYTGNALTSSQLNRNKPTPTPIPSEIPRQQSTSLTQKTKSKVSSRSPSPSSRLGRFRPRTKGLSQSPSGRFRPRTSAKQKVSSRSPSSRLKQSTTMSKPRGLSPKSSRLSTQMTGNKSTNDRITSRGKPNSTSEQLVGSTPMPKPDFSQYPSNDDVLSDTYGYGL